jgi:hypothetical protein
MSPFAIVTCCDAEFALSNWKLFSSCSRSLDGPILRCLPSSLRRLRPHVGLATCKRSSVMIATRWVVTGTGMLVLGLSTRTWDSVQGLTGLASARDVLPEEVSGPLTFEDNLLDLFLTTTQLYTDHSSQLGGRTLYNSFLTYFLLIHLLASLPFYLVTYLSSYKSSTATFALCHEMAIHHNCRQLQSTPTFFFQCPVRKGRNTTREL